MPLRKRWCFLLGRRQQHFGCLAVEEKKTLALCSPSQMDFLHQRKTMFLKCILLLHPPSPLQKGYIYEYKLFNTIKDLYYFFSQMICATFSSQVNSRLVQVFQVYHGPLSILVERLSL